MNIGFGHLTIFLIGEAKLREVMEETVLPRVLPVDVNLKPFSVLEFSQLKPSYAQRRKLDLRKFQLMRW